jgi:hypothetical protein
MPKVADIFMVTRDPETGDPTGSLSQAGTTEDDGATVLIGLGYLPGIATAAANGDVTVTVLTTTTDIFEPTAAEAVPDVENNTQTITFTR